jgi:hypothetical protein
MERFGDDVYRYCRRMLGAAAMPVLRSIFGARISN